MSEWYDSQKKPLGDLRQLLQERIEKSMPKREVLTPNNLRSVRPGLGLPPKYFDML